MGRLFWQKEHMKSYHKALALYYMCTKAKTFVAHHKQKFHLNSNAGQEIFELMTRLLLKAAVSSEDDAWCCGWPVKSRLSTSTWQKLTPLQKYLSKFKTNLKLEEDDSVK